MTTSAPTPVSQLPSPVCYPARPVNGGPLEKALPKSGKWQFEAKYNGWRAWVHTPTGRMFNRENQPLSIGHEFQPVLDRLKQTYAQTGVFEWLDCEALERRHGIGRGSLIILDFPAAGTYDQRRFTLEMASAFYGVNVHKYVDERIPNDTLCLSMRWDWAGATQMWDILKQCNKALNCEFYEGVVAKRTDSSYPIQLRSPGLEFPFWMKHRWAF